MAWRVAQRRRCRLGVLGIAIEKGYGTFLRNMPEREVRHIQSLGERQKTEFIQDEDPRTDTRTSHYDPSNGAVLQSTVQRPSTFSVTQRRRRMVE